MATTSRQTSTHYVGSESEITPLSSVVTGEGEVGLFRFADGEQAKAVRLVPVDFVGRR